MSILNKQVSYFPNKNASTQGTEVSLLSILQSNRHRDVILNLRASPPDLQKQLKESLPCYTVAGTFSRRCKEGIITLSGLAAVDLDSAEDYDIPHLLMELRKIESIAYAGLSCRGKRLFAIVPFLYPDKYSKHYEELIKSFTKMGLSIGDECHKQISQPRFVSWSDEPLQFFNHNARAYHLLAPEKIFHPVKRSYPKPVGSGIPLNPFQWCNEQINKSHSFSEGNRHEYIVQLARYCNQKGLQQEETLSGCLGYIQSDFTEGEITKIVKHIYTTQNDSHNKYPFTERMPQQQAQPSVEKKPEEKIQEEAIIQETPKAEIPEPLHEKWGQQIVAHEIFFQSITLPVFPIRLNSHTTINDISQFIQSHLSVVKANNGNRTFEPYLERLFDLKNLLSSK